MHTQLADLPAMIAALLLIILIPALAILCLVLLRRRIGFEALVVNNEVAGFKYATLGVAYAVLATFLMVSVWERFEDAQSAIDDETMALSVLFHMSRSLPPAEAAEIQGLAAAYLDRVLDVEVPRLQAGGADYTDGNDAVDALGAAVLQAAAVADVPAPVLDRLLAAYVDVIDARIARVSAADGSLPPILWWFVVIGGLICVGFTFFFASRNVAAQAAMTGLLGVIIMSLVFSTVMMNHPFVGDIAVDLQPYETLRVAFAQEAG